MMSLAGWRGILIRPQHGADVNILSQQACGESKEEAIGTSQACVPAFALLAF
jgi:hypothetical protein